MIFEIFLAVFAILYFLYFEAIKKSKAKLPPGTVVV